MSAAHYRDTCSRCIELEKQVSELRQEQTVRNMQRFWTYEIKRRRWPDTHNPVDWYVGCFSVCVMGGFLVGVAVGFYPTWLVFAAMAMITVRTELIVVRTPVYVAADIIGRSAVPVGYGL